MGEMLFCDMCGKNVAIRDALQGVWIEKTRVADVCLNCAQTLTNTIAKTKRDVEAARAAPPKAAEPEPAAEQLPEEPGRRITPEAPKEEEKKGE